MKRIKLSKEEKTIENALLRGEYTKVSDKEMKAIQQALTVRKKDYTMTIRVNSEDIKKIKRKAAKAGVKYQTFISEVLHKVALF
ncbi:MAG: hypothetical protein ABIH08_00255 [Candidatus Omnitrophota bacterium]